MRKYKPLQTAALAVTTALVACSLVAPAIAWGSEGSGTATSGGSSSVTSQFPDVTPTSGQTYGTDTSDVIDTSATGSITIHKYDFTAMDIDGIGYASALENGEEQTLSWVGDNGSSQYAIKGVEFTVLKVADVSTYTANTYIANNDESTQTTESTQTIETVYGIDSELCGYLGLDLGSGYDISKIPGSNAGLFYYSANQIDGAMRAIRADTGTKNNLEKYVVGKGSKSVTTNENGVASATDLPVGLYLVVETKVPEDVTSTTDPFFVSLPMTSADGDSWFYDVNVYPKNETGYPTITKRVADADDSDLLTGTAAAGAGIPYGDTCTASGGDTLNMRIIVKLPVISSDATNLTEWKIVDQQPGGIAYTQSDVYVKFYNNEGDALAGKNPVTIPPGGTQWQYAPNSPSSYFDVSWKGPDENGVSSMTVSLNSLGLAAVNDSAGAAANGQSSFSGRYMVVYYTSEVESNAGTSGGLVLGDTVVRDPNTNEAVSNNCPATLSWKRTNTEYVDSISTSVRVFSYGIDLTKAFSDTNSIASLAPQVEFTLRNVSEEHWYESTQWDNYYIKATGQNGVYEVIESDGATGTNPTDAANATRFKVATDGTLKIYGLEGGTYELVEVATADGYSLLKQPITITISETVGVVTDELYTDRATANNDPESSASPILPTSYAYARIEAATSKVDDNSASMDPDPVSSHDSANALVKLQITNNPSFLLPQTGGVGMWAITIVGVAGVGLGAALLIRSRKSDDKK